MPGWGPDPGDPWVFRPIGNRVISGPADFGVLGGVGGWLPPDGELELPSKAEDNNPGANELRCPKLEPEFGESVTDDDAGGEESFSKEREGYRGFESRLSQINPNLDYRDVI